MKRRRKTVVDVSMVALIFVLLISVFCIYQRVPKTAEAAVTTTQLQSQTQKNHEPTIIGSYTVSRDDTLWKIAGRAYPGHVDRKKIEWIANANLGKITNPDHIETGWIIVIPPAPLQSRQSASRRNVGSPAPATKPIIPAATTATLPAPAVTSSISLSKKETLPEPSALALTTLPLVLPKFPYSHTPRVLLANTTGYRLPLPVQVAMQSKIPLRGNFDSQIFLYESELDKERGWFTGVINQINTRAERKNNEVTLSFELRQLPSKPFLVVVAGSNIDGATFASQTQPFAGKFPGPRGGTRMLLAMGRISIPYAIACGVTMSPVPAFVGLGHMAIPTVMSAIMRHSANRLEAKAEAKLQRDLADNRKLLNGRGMPPGIMPITSTKQLPGGGL